MASNPTSSLLDRAGSSHSVSDDHRPWPKRHERAVSLEDRQAGRFFFDDGRSTRAVCACAMLRPSRGNYGGRLRPRIDPPAGDLPPTERARGQGYSWRCLPPGRSNLLCMVTHRWLPGFRPVNLLQESCLHGQKIARAPSIIPSAPAGKSGNFACDGVAIATFGQVRSFSMVAGKAIGQKRSHGYSPRSYALFIETALRGCRYGPSTHSICNLPWPRRDVCCAPWMPSSFACVVGHCIGATSSQKTSAFAGGSNAAPPAGLSGFRRRSGRGSLPIDDKARRRIARSDRDVILVAIQEPQTRAMTCGRRELLRESYVTSARLTNTTARGESGRAR